MTTPAPSHPNKLADSKWSAVNPENRQKHWQVVRLDKKTGEVVLETVLDGHQVRLPWRELRDRSRWQPGWS